MVSVSSTKNKLVPDHAIRAKISSACFCWGCIILSIDLRELLENRQSRSRRIGVTRSKKQTKVNANANTTELDLSVFDEMDLIAA